MICLSFEELGINNNANDLTVSSHGLFAPEFWNSSYNFWMFSSGNFLLYWILTCSLIFADCFGECFCVNSSLVC